MTQRRKKLMELRLINRRCDHSNRNRLNNSVESGRHASRQDICSMREPPTASGLLGRYNKKPIFEASGTNVIPMISLSN